MPGVDASVPSETDLLCEFCGYTLNGLPPDGRCPECGRAVADSLGAQRHPPAWESPAPPPAWARFLKTTLALIFSPSRFYRTFTSRGPDRPARTFARVHWGFTSALFATASFVHADWYNVRLMSKPRPSVVWWPVLALATYAFLAAVTHVAARLTVFEANWRAYRLPLRPVLRGLYYHAAHFLPVGLVAAGTVVGYQWLLYYAYLDTTSARLYLYVLCGEVILCAAYLFETYWVAMRNMMYANK